MFFLTVVCWFDFVQHFRPNLQRVRPNSCVLVRFWAFWSVESVIFIAWVTFFSDWYLGEFWSDWDKQYLFSEQNFAGNSLKVVSKWLEKNTKLPPVTDLYVDQHFFSLIFLTKPFNFQEKKGDTYYFIFCLLDKISFNILMTFLLP